MPRKRSASSVRGETPRSAKRCVDAGSTELPVDGWCCIDTSTSYVVDLRREESRRNRTGTRVANVWGSARRRRALPRCRGSRGGTPLLYAMDLARSPTPVVAWCYGIFRRFATTRPTCLPLTSFRHDGSSAAAVRAGKDQDEQIQQQHRAVRRATGEQAGRTTGARRQALRVPRVRDRTLHVQQLADVLASHSGDTSASARAERRPAPVA